MAARRRKKLDTYLSPYTKINFSWTKDLNMKPESVRIKHKHILHDVEKNILNRIQFAQDLEPIID